MPSREAFQITPKYNGGIYKRLRARLGVDTLRLSEELERNPDLVQEIGEHLAMAISRRDDKAIELKEVKSLAGSELRYAEGKKLAEAQVTAELDGHADVMEATRRHEAAKLDASLWGTLMDSAKTKTSSLKHISELTVSGWLTPNSHYEGRKKEVGKGRRPLKEYLENDD